MTGQRDPCAVAAMCAIATAALPRLLATALACAAIAGVNCLSPAAAEPVRFSADEIERIASHGPWPPSSAVDPSNRVSGRAEAIAFGQRLFFDGRLSSTGVISCAWCHQAGRAWTDGRARAQALAPGERNTQSLFNLAAHRWFGWAGSSDSLWMASLRAIVDAREMGSSAARVAREMRRRPDLACEYRVVFGREVPLDDDEAVLADVAKALAAFQQTLSTGRTAFDAFRDALMHDDRVAMAAYPRSAQRGLRLFVGRGNCSLCHTGPNFTNGEFHDIGIPFFVRPGVVDPGRHAGLRAVLASPYNLLGRHNDEASRANAIATRHATLEHRHWGEWRTPSLRNVELTAPYMHNGLLPTLHEVVRRYSELDLDRLHGDREQILRPLRLGPEQIDDLIAFLRTLTSPVEPPTKPPAPGC